MCIKIGDLVKKKTIADSEVGLVVDVKMPHEGLTVSEHMKHMLTSYQKVVYVLFPREEKAEQLRESDLVVQLRHSIGSSMVS
jgi:hypothetical protein